MIRYSVDAEAAWGLHMLAESMTSAAASLQGSAAELEDAATVLYLNRVNVGLRGPA